MSQGSGPTSPNSRRQWLISEYEKRSPGLQRRNGYVDEVSGRIVFVNHATEVLTKDEKEKLKYKAHLSHSPLVLTRYNRTRRLDFDKALPDALLKLEVWNAVGGFDSDPRFLSDSSDNSEDSEEEKESESCYDNQPGTSTMPTQPSSQQGTGSCPADKSSSSDRTEEATLVSDDSLVGTGSNPSTDGEAVETVVAKEDANDASAAARQVMEEIVDRVVKVHDKVQAIKLKWISLKRG